MLSCTWAHVPHAGLQMPLGDPTRASLVKRTAGDAEARRRRLRGRLGRGSATQLSSLSLLEGLASNHRGCVLPSAAPAAGHSGDAGPVLTRSRPGVKPNGLGVVMGKHKPPLPLAPSGVSAALPSPAGTCPLASSLTVCSGCFS